MKYMSKRYEHGEAIFYDGENADEVLAFLAPGLDEDADFTVESIKTGRILFGISGSHSVKVKPGMWVFKPGSSDPFWWDALSDHKFRSYYKEDIRELIGKALESPDLEADSEMRDKLGAWYKDE